MGFLSYVVLVDIYGLSTRSSQRNHILAGKEDSRWLTSLVSQRQSE